MEVCLEDVVPACHNGETNTTISGPAEAVDSAIRQMQDKKMFVREVDSAGIAFHSPAIKPCVDPFLMALQKVNNTYYVLNCTYN